MKSFFRLVTLFVVILMCSQFIYGQTNFTSVSVSSDGTATVEFMLKGETFSITEGEVSAILGASIERIGSYKGRLAGKASIVKYKGDFAGFYYVDDSPSKGANATKLTQIRLSNRKFLDINYLYKFDGIAKEGKVAKVSSYPDGFVQFIYISTGPNAGKFERMSGKINGVDVRFSN